MSTLERLKVIATKGERWPKGAELEVLIALPKLLALVDAVEETLSIETPQKVLDALKALREETK